MRLLLLLCLIFASSEILVAQENIALGKRVAASETTGRSPAAYMTDGDYSTFGFPDGSYSNFHFLLDLDDSYNFSQIVIVNTTSPERLSNYRVEIFSGECGIMGPVVWSANIREDNTNSGSGGQDIITADLDSDGFFNGQYIKITNYSTNQTAPGIAEIEVYEAPLPMISYFESDAGNITKTANPDLPTSANISWQASDFTSLSINQGIGDLSIESGDIAVDPSATTVYTLTASNDNGTTTKTITIGVDETVLNPMITEFMASNGCTMVYDDEDAEDWIELYNPNDFSLNIQGYYLTDDVDVLNKWAFPARTMEPNGYLTVLASEEDISELGAAIHTNFGLNADGDYLALVAKNGSNVLQQFPDTYPSLNEFPNQKKDISYGIDSDGNTGYFQTPTPNAENASIESGFVGEVKFEPNRGVYTSTVVVEIDCETTDAVIRYTTDGSEPTSTTGSILTGSTLVVSKTQVVRARAFKDGLVASKLKTHTYVIVDDVVTSSVMNTAITSNSIYKAQIEKALVELPSISLNTGKAINNTTEVETSVEWIDPTTEENLQLNAGIKYFGGAFTNFDKENFRLYFRGVYGDEKLEHPLFKGFEHGIPAVERFDQLDLRAGGHDMGSRGFYMSSRLADDIMLESGTLNPHGRFINVYLNGVYWGQYHLRERWSDNMFAEYYDEPKENFEAINGNNNLGGWASDLEIPYAGDGSAWENAKSLREDYDGIKEYVDVHNLVNFMLTWMYGNSENEFKAVGSISPGPNGFKFYMNDGDGYTRSAGNRTTMSQPGINAGDGPGSIFSMLLSEGHSDYLTLLADQIQKMYFNDGILTPDRITALLDERWAEIENSLVAESARWGYLSPAEWVSKKEDYVDDVLSSRTASAVSQYKSAGFMSSIDAPVFSQHGGVVDTDFQLSLSTNTNTIYYTEDGSDPRLPGGGISDQAIEYTAGSKETVTLVGEDTDVSALVPADGTLGTSWTAVDFTESSWLQNTGGAGVGYDEETTYDAHIDLSVDTEMNGINASVYIRYVFDLDDLTNIESVLLNMKTDDGYVAYLNGEVIASFNAPSTLSWNSGATTSNSDFAAVISTGASISHANIVGLLNLGTNVLAIHGLNLSTSSSDFLCEAELLLTKTGEDDETDQIIITESIGINARAYEDGAWSAINEATFTLTKDVDADMDVVINEFMASNTMTVVDQDNEFEDWIELYNNSDINIDLEGYYLTDDTLNLTKWPFPSGTIINTGDYLTIWADEDGSQEGLHANFKLSASEESVVIVRPDGTTILDQVNYPTQLTDISYGRYPNGTGDFGVMNSTFGTVNGDLLDDDQDGIAANLDCNDNDDTIGAKQTIGTTCDDGDSGTINDQVQLDGCNCLGISTDEEHIVINELLASNESTIADQDGEFDDWIELYNTGETAIDLGGYYLSDDADDVSKWAFPDGTTLNAGGYLLVWMDEDQDQEGLHANFKLSATEESVFLLNPSGALLEEVSFSNQNTGISYGRAPNGLGEFKLMSPTPNASNSGEDVLNALDNVTEVTLEIYPNPSNGYFHLEINEVNSEGHDVVIYNLSGNVMFHEKVSESKIISTTKWSPGMYIIKIGVLFSKLTVL